MIARANHQGRLIGLLCVLLALALANSANASPSRATLLTHGEDQLAKPPPIDVNNDDHATSAFGEERVNLGEPEKEEVANNSHPSRDDASPLADRATKPVTVKNAPKKQKVDVRSESCTNMGVRQCAAAQTGCMTDAGGRDQYKPPTITWVRVDGGPWEYAGLSCGPPTSVEVPGASGGPVEVEVEAPPVPTLGQIQTAFRALPFSKPSVQVQPKGQRTAKNLKTFYAAQWPSDKNLQPGETSKPVKLLSWNIEFKVAAKDYRYSYGDGTSSGWTSSTGGTYPDGDITHTYSETGDVEVKVDARLTGRYRVNGGQWQDIATVADLQDEPSFTLEVRGTKTTLVDS